MEEQKTKLEAKSILKKNGKYLYNQDGTPVLVNGKYLYLNEDGSTSLLSNHPNYDTIESQVARITDGESAVEEVSPDLDSTLDPAVSDSVLGYGDEEEQDGTSDPGWDATSTRLVLSLYKVMKDLVDQRKIPTLKKMWIKMAGRLHEHGYNFTPYQIENRYRTLQRSYKRKVVSTTRRGRLQKDLPYERELKEIYEKEKKSPDTLLTAGGEQISIADFLQAAGLGVQRQTQFGAGTSGSRKILTLTPDMTGKIHFSRPAVKPPLIPAPTYFTNHSRRTDVMEELRDLRVNTLEKLRSMENKRDSFNEKVLQELKYRNDLLEKLLEHVP